MDLYVKFYYILKYLKNILCTVEEKCPNIQSKLSGYEELFTAIMLSKFYNSLIKHQQVRRNWQLYQNGQKIGHSWQDFFKYKVLCFAKWENGEALFIYRLF